MAIDDVTLDIAYDIFDEFGPSRGIDRATRLKKALPKLTSDEISILLGKMEEVSKTVWEVAEMGGEAKIGRDKVKELIQVKHPFLQQDGLKQAVFLVNYYAWHEGY